MPSRDTGLPMGCQRRVCVYVPVCMCIYLWVGLRHSQVLPVALLVQQAHPNPVIGNINQHQDRKYNHFHCGRQKYVRFSLKSLRKDVRRVMYAKIFPFLKAVINMNRCCIHFSTLHNENIPHSAQLVSFMRFVSTHLRQCRRSLNGLLAI